MKDHSRSWLILRALAYTLLGIPIVLLILHTILRIVRRFHKFPMPQFAANLIDNPLRRAIQPPDETAIRHGIEAGMTVLEVGPGNGTYTMAVARRVGPAGRIVAIDIEPKMIERVRKRAMEEGIANVQAQVVDVFELPFEDESFDLVYMIAVIGEIPQPELAMRSFHRVLKPAGSLVFSELLFDPDYPRAQTLARWAASAGFEVKEMKGNFFYYTLVFAKAYDSHNCCAKGRGR